MKKEQTKIGVVLSYFNIILACVLSIFITPLLLRILGQAEYGLYQLIGSFVSNITVLDFGLSNTIVRYVSRYRHQNLKKMEGEFLSFVLKLYSIIVLIVVAIGIIMLENIGAIFGGSLTALELSKASIMLSILVVNVIITMPGNIFGALLCSYEEFSFYYSILIGKTFLRVIVIFALLLSNPNAIFLVVLDTCLNVCIVISNWIYCRIKLKIRINLQKTSTLMRKEVFSYTFYIFLTYVSTQILWKVNQTIIGMKMSTSAVAIYSIGVTFSSIFFNLSNGISGVFVSKTNKLALNLSDKTQLITFMVRISRLQAYVLFYVYIAFFLFGNEFISLWAGPNYNESWSTAFFVMTGVLLQGIESIILTVQQALNRHRFYTVVNLVLCLINIISAWVLVDYWGINGAALANMVTMLLGQGVVVNFYVHYKLNINMITYFKKLFHRILPAAICTLIVGLIIVKIGTARTWGSFMVCSTIYTIVYIVCMWWAANKDEREFFVNPILRIFQSKLI